jgi:hypothetical protein
MNRKDLPAVSQLMLDLAKKLEKLSPEERAKNLTAGADFVATRRELLSKRATSATARGATRVARRAAR